MNDFFESIDSMTIIQDHANDVLKLEEREARRMLRIYEKVATRLKKRLSGAPEDTFTSQQMRGVLVQLESAILAIKDDLNVNISESTRTMSERGVRDLITEIQTFEDEFAGAVGPLNLNLMRTAVDTSEYLINNFEASIEAYSGSLRSKISNGLAEMVVERVPTQTMVDRLGQFFAGEEWRLRRIVRTELHNVYGRAKTDGMIEAKRKYLPDLKKTLFHPMDSRTAEDSIYADRRELIVPVSKPFRYKWKGKVREFYAVDRPNDRSIVIPYRPSWDK